ncbi:hypothetical protein EI545_06205 [Tabrizicola piscis]|uniref:Uncharacterized protein n=1 Tax=Tabrizicola piscis TaxID=2494374 RepID=A0A3S8U4I5_9RHOB|nr:hypothetical protein [Tabrizicola piscis]AZL58459.1 hypothetical protein EI545_06205 [Tabrizicola piscis]
MKTRILRAWHQITFFRLRSELAALRRAKVGPRWAAFQIFLVVGLWFFAALSPIYLVIVGYDRVNDSSNGMGAMVGNGLFAVATLYSVILLVTVLPWVLRWFFIAAKLVVGLPAEANSKEAELITAIALVEATIRSA